MCLFQHGSTKNMEPILRMSARKSKNSYSDLSTGYSHFVHGILASRDVSDFEISAFFLVGHSHSKNGRGRHMAPDIRDQNRIIREIRVIRG
jgi:hypothetical protein